MKNRRHLAVAAAILVGTFVTSGRDANAATPLTVTITADSGAGSLRQAMLDANATPSLDTITFSIPGSGIHVITLASALPSITAPVNIDARTQPGYSLSPLVEIDGIGSATTFNVVAGGGGSSIAGLALASYSTGVLSRQPITIDDTWVGVHANGTAGPGQPNNLSNQVNGVDLGPNSTVRRSVFANNGFAAVNLCGRGLELVDNRVGTNPAGTIAMPNLYAIVEQACSGGPQGTGEVHIGRPDHGNVVSGNVYDGFIFNQSDATIEENLVGVGADGTTSIPNGIGGINVSGSNVSVMNNIVANNSYGVGVAGSGTVVGNDIHDNSHVGIIVASGSWQLHTNHIDRDGQLGIDLGNDGVTPNDASDADTGPNGNQNFPQITSITRSNSLLTVRGALTSKPNSDATVEVFQSPTCDPSGFGEGANPRATTTVHVPASGIVDWQVQVATHDASGATWTGTATSVEGTSEFSSCATDTGAPSPPPAAGVWQPIGGGTNDAPAMASPAPGAVTAFVHGLDNHLWEASQPSRSAPWSTWHSIDGGTLSSPAVVGDGHGIVHIVVRGLDERLWYRTEHGTSDSWQRLDGATHDAPAVSLDPDGSLDVFIRGLDDALWHRQRSAGGTWSGWENLGGGLTSAPSTTRTASGDVYVVARGMDAALWSRTRSGTTWGSWVLLGGGLRGAPAIASFLDGSVHVFVRGLDDQLWHRARQSSQWSPFEALGGALTSGPGVAADVSTNRSSMTIGVRGTDGQVWVRRYEASSAG